MYVRQKYPIEDASCECNLEHFDNVQCSVLDMSILIFTSVDVIGVVIPIQKSVGPTFVAAIPVPSPISLSIFLISIFPTYVPACT